MINQWIFLMQWSISNPLRFFKLNSVHKIPFNDIFHKYWKMIRLQWLIKHPRRKHGWNEKIVRHHVSWFCFDWSFSRRFSNECHWSSLMSRSMVWLMWSFSSSRFHSIDSSGSSSSMWVLSKNKVNLFRFDQVIPIVKNVKESSPMIHFLSMVHFVGHNFVWIVLKSFVVFASDLFFLQPNFEWFYHRFFLFNNFVCVCFLPSQRTGLDDLRN